MAIENKNLFVWLKAISRGQALPLDASEVHDSFEEAQLYSSSLNAYAGQTIKALLDDGHYHTYVLQPSGIGYSLEEVGASSGNNNQCVVVGDTLPSEGQEQGVIYIETSGLTGSIWNGFGWIKVFSDIDPAIASVRENIKIINESLVKKAPIDNPSFTGIATVRGEEIAIKSYVDGLFARLGESVSVPDIVDSTHPIPGVYQSGKTYRVAEAGVYVGQECEVGDLIIVIADYNKDAASNNDFIVLQSNIDGAVTSVADTTAVGEIVLFDSVTGKVINGSGVNIASLNDAIAKSHRHENKAILDSYNKSQEQIISDAQTLVDALKASVAASMKGKADKGTTLADYGIINAYTSNETDAKLQAVIDNLNTKATSSEVDTKIANAKAETIVESATHVEVRIGGIPEDTTIKAYIDDALTDISAFNDEKIAIAKQEAIQESTNTSKLYMDSKIAKVISALTITEF